MKEMILEPNKKEIVQEKKKNTGFSLVELIVVIAIMAILAVVIAPQIIKYIDRGRRATDKSTASLYETAATTTIADEDCYNEVVATGGLKIEVAGSTPVYKDVSGAAVIVTKFKTEFEDILQGQLKAPAASNTNHFEVTINVSSGKVSKITSEVK